MRSLVIGLGIGQLYCKVLKDLDAVVYTVDQDASKDPDFYSVEEAFDNGNHYDTVHIATPNFTHKSITDSVMVNNLTKNAIVFVDKPGFKNHLQWSNIITYTKQLYNQPRLMMVKNNQYRENISIMIDDAVRSKVINIDWINENRVPNPGTWFTNKELAWGGVSRDLMPHLLSYIPKFYPYDYQNARVTRMRKIQNWKLSDLQSSDYGNVDPNGIYNVDDFCEIELELNDKRITLTADWRSMKESAIVMSVGDYIYHLGLCPEEAYSNMIKTAIDNKNNDIFWQNQYEQDLWIHQIIDGI